jgi:trypsin
VIPTLLLVVGLHAPLRAEAPPPPVVNGTPTDEYAAVGAIVAERDGLMYGSYCTGTLLDATWVVTAAHCIESMQDEYAAYAAYFVVGSDLLAGGIDAWARVEEAFVYPSWNDITLEGDIGLLRLAGEGIADVRPMRVNRDALDDAWLGRELRLVGFGVTRDGNGDGDIKRSADVPVWDYDEAFVYTYDPIDQQNACSGDSGGAGLELVEGGRAELTGVISFGWAPHDGDSCVDGALAMVRVDRYLSWVEGYVDLSAVDYGDTGEDTGQASPGDSEDEAPAGCSCGGGPTGPGALLLAAWAAGLLAVGRDRHRWMVESLSPSSWSDHVPHPVARGPAGPRRLPQRAQTRRHRQHPGAHRRRW